MSDIETATIKRRLGLIEGIIKKAMRLHPSGEHLHVGSIVVEQTILIDELKCKVRSLRRRIALMKKLSETEKA